MILGEILVYISTFWIIIFVFKCHFYIYSNNHILQVGDDII